MENFEATNSTTVAAEAGVEKQTYSREVTEMMAKEEALDRFEERFPGAILLPTSEKIPALKELINELGATVEGTDIPLYNEHRHVVEQLSILLRTEEAQAEVDALMARLQAKA